jgi:preprotein translocase subunit SecE
VNKDIINIFIWVGVLGAVFAFLWWKGYLLGLRNYWNETAQELKKCTWPTWDELKGSTMLVAVTIVMLGLMTVVVDYAAVILLTKVLKV